MWKTVKLGDVCDLVGGGTPSKKNNAYYDGDIPWATVRDMNADELCLTEHKITEFGLNSSSSKVIPENNVIIASRVGLGKVCILRQNTAINQDLRGVIPKSENEVDVKFLFYWFKGMASQIISAGRGATVQGVTLPFLNSLSFPLPPLAEQQRIVAKLDAAFAEIDTAIELAEAKEAEVEKLKASLLSDLLSGDAVMSETVKLGDVCELQPAKRQVRQKLSDRDSVSFMPMDCLGIDEIYPRAEKSKTLLEVYSSYTYFEDKDVLLAKITPCFENGKLGVANNLVNGVGFGSSEYIVIRCGKDILPEYVYYHLIQPSFRFEGKKNMSGAVGHKRVPKEFVANREISLPPLPEQQRIVAKLDAAFAEVNSAKQAIQRTRENHAALKAAILAQELTPPTESEAA